MTTTKSSAKTVTKKTTLPKEVFDVEIKNHELLKLSYDSFLASARNAHARSKTRGEVRGGGKKPWRQKGTGRARFGSSRNPIWRGGGVAFGPTGLENYDKKIPTKAKRVALRQALTLANKANKIILATETNISSGKTKDALKLIEKYSVADKTRILGVVGTKTPETMQATNNLPNVKIVSAMYLNVYDILNADAIVFGPSALGKVVDWLGTKKVSVDKEIK